MKIFVVTYGGGHAALVAPVIRELLENGHAVTVLGLTTAAQYLKEQGIKTIGYSDLNGANDDDVQRWGNMLAQDVPNNGTVNIVETKAYLGLNFRELVIKHGESEAFNLYEEYGRQAFLPVEVMKSALNCYKPDLLIATNSPRTERASIIAAGELYIPSICIVDLFALQEVQWIGQPGYADKICVLNESVRQMFINSGREPHEVVVTGNPAFDRLIKHETKLAGLKLKQDKNWNDGKINLLWASQPEPTKHPFNDKVGDPTLPRRIERELRSFVAKHDGFRLIVRYHPSETEKFEPQERVEFSPASENIAVLLNAVDIVVVLTSTVGLEAYLAKKIVISVDCSVFTLDAPFSKLGISRGVSSPRELSEEIIMLECDVRNNRKMSSDLDEYSDSSATTKILNQINLLCEEKFRHGKA